MSYDARPSFMKFPFGLLAGGISIIVLLISLYLMMGVNYNGYRTVVQTAFGNTFVRFTPGPYLVWFGHAEIYPDYITFDFDKNEQNNETRSLNQKGISVRYQEGGTGTVFGQARFKLPDDEATMLALHRAYRTPEGVAYKLVKTSAEEIVNLTANLMTSDESYMEKRSVYSEWVRDQLSNGKYRTTLQWKEVTEEGTDKKVSKNVPIISVGSDGMPQHQASDLKAYSVISATLQLTDWDYEQKNY